MISNALTSNTATANPRLRWRFVDTVFALLAVVLAHWAAGEEMPFSWRISLFYFCALCLAGIVFRWGWIVPNTLLALLFATAIPTFQYRDHLWNLLFWPTFAGLLQVVWVWYWRMEAALPEDKTLGR